MSQDNLKDYTIQTLTFGEEFLNKLNGTQLPDDVSCMQKGLLECIKELKTVWNSVTKHAFKLTGNCDMDKLKEKLNEREKKTNTIFTRSLNKCMSLTEVLDTEIQIDEEAINKNKTLSPTYTNMLPRVPTKKVKVKLKPSFSVEPHMKSTENIRPRFLTVKPVTSLQDQTNHREKSPVLDSLSKSMEVKLDENVVRNATLDVPNCEPGYVKLKKERRLPPVTKFTKVNKAKNVWINHWQLGERYCGIADDILYIFFSFQEQYAEISMALTDLYIGKGFGNNEEKGNTVLFQSREVHLILDFASEKLQNEFYKISFSAQNKNAFLQNTLRSVPSPLMPKPYAKKSSKQYLNVVIEPQPKVSYPYYDSTNTIDSANTIDSGEEDYVDMVTPQLNSF